MPLRLPVTEAMQPLAILSALAEEQAGLVERLEQARCVQHAGRTFWLGHLEQQPVVLALSRIGKVAAATTTAALVERFGVQGVVFTGVAGGVGEGVHVGDVVVGAGYVQHDMDASPLFPRYQIPMTPDTVFAADVGLSDAMHAACELALAQWPVASHAVRAPRIHQGLIASGDQFVSSAEAVRRIVQDLHAHGHRPLAVEMEGAAVAQVCADYGVPFVAVRTISDRADDTAHVDFPKFIAEVASRYAQEIILALMRARNGHPHGA